MKFIKYLLSILLIWSVQSKEISVYYSNMQSFAFNCPKLDLSKGNVPLLRLQDGSEHINIAVFTVHFKLLKEFDWLESISWSQESNAFKIVLKDVNKLNGKYISCVSVNSDGFGSVVENFDFKFFPLIAPKPSLPENKITKVGVLLDASAYTSTLSLNCSFYTSTPNTNLLISWYKDDSDIPIKEFEDKPGEKPMSLNYDIQVPFTESSQFVTYRCVGEPTLSLESLRDLSDSFGSDYVAYLKSELKSHKTERIIQLIEDSKPTININTKIVHTGYEVDEVIYIFKLTTGYT